MLNKANSYRLSFAKQPSTDEVNSIRSLGYVR